MSDSETDLEDKRARLMKMLNDEERYIYLHLKEKDTEDFRTIFNIFDKDGGGSIEESEIRQVFQSLGQDPTEDEVKTMINSVDENNDGTVDFEEFLLLMAK
jgi:calmodulin